MSSILRVGLASPLGLGRADCVRAWLDGRGGPRPNDRWPTEGFPRQDAGLVEGFFPRKHLPNRKAVKLMSRESQLAVFAAVEAAAGLDLVERLGVPATRIGAFAAAGYEVSSLEDSEAMLASSRDPKDPSTIVLRRLFSSGRDVYNPLCPLKSCPICRSSTRDWLWDSGVRTSVLGPPQPPDWPHSEKPTNPLQAGTAMQPWSSAPTHKLRNFERNCWWRLESFPL